MSLLVFICRAIGFDPLELKDTNWGQLVPIVMIDLPIGINEISIVPKIQH